MTWIASRVEDSMAALLRSGRRFSKSCATSATSTVLATAAVTAAIEMTTGVVIATTVTTIATTTIGGDEFHSLGINPHLTSACYLLVYLLPEGLGSNAGAFILSIL